MKDKDKPWVFAWIRLGPNFNPLNGKDLQLKPIVPDYAAFHLGEAMDGGIWVAVFPEDLE